MILDEITRKRTLQELDGEEWGEPTFFSHLVTECHRLRTVPLETMSAEDLRINIGQNLSLDYLIPLALEQLEVEPWISGDYYEGDLLKNVLSIPVVYWDANAKLKRIFERIVTRALAQTAEAPPEEIYFYDENVVRLLQAWTEPAQPIL